MPMPVYKGNPPKSALGLCLIFETWLPALSPKITCQTGLAFFISLPTTSRGKKPIRSLFFR
jgi:hypothetical protein